MAKPWEKYKQAAPAAKDGPWAKYATREQQPITPAAPEQPAAPEEPGFFERAADIVTGESRETRATRELPELPEAAGFLSSEDPTTVAKVAPALITTTEPQEMADILSENFPSIGIQYDEKGNIIAANNQTGQRVVLNKPGMSKMDVVNMLGLGSLYAAGGPTGGIARTAATEAAKEAGIQALQAGAGGQFDVTDVLLAGGAGGALKGAEDLATTAYRAMTGAVPEAAAKQIAEAEVRGLKPTTSDIMPPTTAPGRFAKQVGEQTPVFGTARAQEAKQSQRQQLAEEYVSEFTPSYDDIISSLKSKRDKVKGAAVQARKNVTDQVSDKELVTSNTIDAIDDEIKRLTTLPNGQPRKNIDTATVNTLENYKADLQSDASFDNLDKLRTDFRTDVKGDDVLVSNRKQGAINRIYGAMTKDMDEVVKSEMTPREFTRWKKANAIYGAEAEKLKKTRLKTLLQKGDQVSSADINRQILSGDDKVRQNLFKSLDTTGRQNARAAIIRTIADNASRTGELSVNQFLSQVRKNKGAINDFFKGSDRKALEGLVTALEATKSAQDAAVVTKSGMQAIPYITGASALASLPATIAGAAGAGTLSRIYESRPVRDALLKLSSVPKGSTQFEQALEQAVYAVTGASQVLRSELTE